MTNTIEANPWKDNPYPAMALCFLAILGYAQIHSLMVSVLQWAYNVPFLTGEVAVLLDSAAYDLTNFAVFLACGPMVVYLRRWLAKNKIAE